MATNCIIGRVMENGAVEGIYCHNGGYVDGVGRTLVHCYGEDEAEKLMRLGAISSLGEAVEPPFGALHSFEHPCPGVTVAYHRDRGDRFDGCFKGKDVRDFLCNAPSITYTYLYLDGDWYLHVANDPVGLRLAAALI